MTNIETQAKTAFGKTLHYVTDPVYADALTRLMCPVRPCCAETHRTRKSHASHRVYNNAACQGGNPT